MGDVFDEDLTSGLTNGCLFRDSFAFYSSPELRLSVCLSVGAPCLCYLLTGYRFSHVESHRAGSESEQSHSADDEKIRLVRVLQCDAIKKKNKDLIILHIPGIITFFIFSKY